MTFAEYMTRWLTEYVQDRVAERTGERYEGIARNHLVPAFGEMALECAVDWGLIDKNPASRASPPPIPPGWIRVLDEEATKNLLRGLRGHALYLPCVIAAGTGMRRGEILALRWSEVDLGRSVLSVVRSLEQTSRGLTFKAPKTRRSRRQIVLPGFLTRELAGHRGRQAEQRAAASSYEDHDLVIARPDGSPWPPDSFSAEFRRQLAIRNLPRIRFHGLRHGHASHMLRQGVHPKIVSERLGGLDRCWILRELGNNATLQRNTHHTATIQMRPHRAGRLQRPGRHQVRSSQGGHARRDGGVDTMGQAPPSPLLEAVAHAVLGETVPPENWTAAIVLNVGTRS